MTVLKHIDNPEKALRCSCCGTRRGQLMEFGDYVTKTTRQAWNAKYTFAGKLALPGAPPPERVPFIICRMCHMLHYLWSWYFEKGELPNNKLFLKALKLWKALRVKIYDTRS